MEIDLVLVLAGFGAGLVYGFIHWLTKYYRDGRPIRIGYLGTTVLLGGLAGIGSAMANGIVPGQVAIEAQLLGMTGIIGLSDPIVNALMDKKEFTRERLINILLKNGLLQESVKAITSEQNRDNIRNMVGSQDNSELDSAPSEYQFTFNNRKKELSKSDVSNEIDLSKWYR